LRVVARIPLPGSSSRFDYASLDPVRGLLFVAHLGASQVVEINIRTGRVVRTIPGLPQVHGVLVVPALHRVYATATAADLVARISEGTGRVLGTTATGAYPDGLAYDPANRTIWTTNESGSKITDATMRSNDMTRCGPSGSGHRSGHGHPGESAGIPGS
jgi:DNA-binding beta-propeller fold protein YncE